MLQIARRVLAVIAALSCSAAIAAEEHPIDVPELHGIAIDGNAGDWGTQGFRVDLLPGEDGQVRPAQDLDVRFRLGWDERGLLVLVKVRDAYIVEEANLEQIARRSSLTLYVATEVGSKEWYRVDISPGIDPKQPELRCKVFDFRHETKTEEPPVVTAARSKGEHGYVMEVLLPWKNLGMKPGVGGKVGLQLVVNAATRPDGDRAYRAPWFRSFEPGESSMLMRELRLVEKGAEFEATAAAGHATGWRPRVQVAGPAALSGKIVEVKQGESVLATGRMEAEDDRAFAEVAWDHPSWTEEVGKIAVFLDARQIATPRLPVPAMPALRINRKTRDASNRQYTFTVAAIPGGETLVGLEARWELLTPEGSKSLDEHGALKQEEPVTLPEGLSQVRCVVPSLSQAAETAYLFSDHPAVLLETVLKQARAMQVEPKYAACTGWIEYATHELETSMAPEGKDQPRAAVEMGFCLAQWMEKVRVADDPLAVMRGQVEWAYLSKADGTGQPFVVSIPKDYDSKKKYPMFVSLHGNGGTAGEFGMPYDEPYFKLSVTGRARAGSYRGLMEVNILDAMEYVTSHWSVDPDRVHLIGASMGGGGAFLVAARHPDLFATARPMSGYAIEAPVENLLHVPVWSLHSQDDFTVPIFESRAPLRLLAELGGRVIADETNGIGHDVRTKYLDGIARARDWSLRETRARDVREIRYTALDEYARKAYWVEVAEWGPAGRPARVQAAIDGANTLYLTLDNVESLRVMVGQSPAQRKTEMMVVVNRAVVRTVEAPLPEELYVVRRGQGWDASAEKPETPAERLHFPGGAMALFHGEPIMVVWGTKGSEKACKAIYDIAQVARHMPKPGWPAPDSPGGTPRSYIVYGMLPGKPDTELTAEDIGKYNLLLIGTAGQNAVVARLAGKLPVRVEGGRVIASDGISWDFTQAAVGVLWHNPEAPGRLIYWVGSDSAEFYKPDAQLMGMQGFGSPADLIITGLDGRPVAMRRFDSRWNWEPGYANSPLLPESYCTDDGFRAGIAKAIGREVGADLSFKGISIKPERLVWSAGQSRVMDALAMQYDMRMATLDLSGREIAEFTKRFADGGRFMPESKIARLEPDRVYRVALYPYDMGAYVYSTHDNPASFRLLEGTVRGALEHHLVDGER